MTDDRPRPQYGEYATPEQQAAAMGKHYVPPTPPPAPETRVNLAPPTAEGQQPAVPMTLPGNAADRFATIFQIGIGVVALINSDYFQFSAKFNATMSGFGSSLRVPASIDHFAWLLLAANAVFLILTALWAYSRIRHDKLAFFVPVIGLLAFDASFGIFMSLLAR
jgi:hypothetical protein